MAWMDVTHFTDADLVELSASGLLFDKLLPKETEEDPYPADVTAKRLQRRRRVHEDTWRYFVQVDE